MSSDLSARLRKALAFENPDVDGSEFHNLVINQSIPHTKRDGPAWMYSIHDAAFGAGIENARLSDIHAALIEAVEALEIISKNIERPCSMTDAELMLRKIEVKCDNTLAKLVRVLPSEVE